MIRMLYFWLLLFLISHFYATFLFKIKNYHSGYFGLFFFFCLKGNLNLKHTVTPLQCVSSAANFWTYYHRFTANHGVSPSVAGMLKQIEGHIIYGMRAQCLTCQECGMQWILWRKAIDRHILMWLISNSISLLKRNHFNLGKQQHCKKTSLWEDIYVVED